MDDGCPSMGKKKEKGLQAVWEETKNTTCNNKSRADPGQVRNITKKRRIML